MKFNERLTALRNKKNLTQDQVADALGIKRARYNAWENDISKPDLNKIVEIAKFFNVTTDFLMGLSDHDKSTFVLDLENQNVYENLRQYIEKFINAADIKTFKHVTESNSFTLRNILRYSILKFQDAPVDALKLISAAFAGLKKADDNFNDGGGGKFISFAQRCIENEIMIELRKLNMITYPKSSTMSIESETKLNTKEERDLAADLEKMINDLESEEALAFQGEPMDEETKELMRISLENSLRLAKQMAKQKFNPNKNK